MDPTILSASTESKLQSLKEELEKVKKQLEKWTAKVDQAHEEGDEKNMVDYKECEAHYLRERDVISLQIRCTSPACSQLVQMVLTQDTKPYAS